MKYNLTDQAVRWTDLKQKSLENKEQVDEIVELFQNQLKEDAKKLDSGEEVSDCALNTPRMYSSLDKKNKFARILCKKLFPYEEENEKQKKWAYIRYSQYLSKLTKKFKSQVEDEYNKEQEYKIIRKTGQRDNFDKLKERDLTSFITEPTPMPVEVAKEEDVTPFFDHLKTNTPAGQECLEFKRGAHYEDKRIDFCKQVAGPVWIGSLMDSIRQNPYVDHFLLGNNIINQTGAEEIAKFIKDESKVPKIRTWYIAGNEIDSEGTRKIADALRNDPYAESLWLKRNPVKPEGAKYLGDMLKVNSKIEVLDLHNTGILDEGLKYIMKGLKHNSTLKLLYLDANGITSKGAEYVSEYFDYLNENGKKGITSLWIGINRLDDEGIIRLAGSIKDYPYLKRLVVSSNRFGPKGAKVLLDSLTYHPKLKFLDIGFYKSTGDLGELPNNIGDVGAKYIAEFIEKNKTVEVLGFEQNNISAKSLELIVDALEKNDTMFYMYYGQYGIELDKSIKERIHNRVSENIKNRLGIEFEQFHSNRLRFIKHTENIKYIDSIYRNKM